MKCGIPFDVAFSLDPETRAAWSIRMGMFDGGQFDWEEGRFKEPEGG